MTEQEKKAMIQNLIDAGCNQDIINKFNELDEKGDICEKIRLLAAHRKELLDCLNTCKKRIDCLDYLIVKLTKTVTESEKKQWK